MSLMEKAGKANSNSEHFQFWIQDNKRIEFYGKNVFDQKLEYIHLNPVQDGFVVRPEHWYYSSARNFTGLKGGI